MNNVRLQICTGLFRSATNLQSFENMLAILGAQRPAAGSGKRRRPELSRACVRPGRGAGKAPASLLPRPRCLTRRRRRASSAASKCRCRTRPPRPAPAEPEIQLPKVTVRRETPKVGRNDPCPCGSGKKYKHCHGK